MINTNVAFIFFLSFLIFAENGQARRESFRVSPQSGDQSSCTAGFTLYKPWAECRDPSHGVERYKSAQSVACGRNIVPKTCRLQQFGTETILAVTCVLPRNLRKWYNEGKFLLVARNLYTPWASKVSTINWCNYPPAPPDPEKISPESGSTWYPTALPWEWTLHSNNQFNFEEFTPFHRLGNNEVDGYYVKVIIPAQRKDYACGNYEDGSFKTCRHADHGVELYKMVADSICGPETDVAALRAPVDNSNVSKNGEFLLCTSECEAKQNIEAIKACFKNQLDTASQLKMPEFAKASSKTHFVDGLIDLILRAKKSGLNTDIYQTNISTQLQQELSLEDSAKSIEFVRLARLLTNEQLKTMRTKFEERLDQNDHVFALYTWRFDRPDLFDSNWLQNLLSRAAGSVTPTVRFRSMDLYVRGNLERMSRLMSRLSELKTLEVTIAKSSITEKSLNEIIRVANMESETRALAKMLADDKARFLGDVVEAKAQIRALLSQTSQDLSGIIERRRKSIEAYVDQVIATNPTEKELVLLKGYFYILDMDFFSLRAVISKATGDLIYSSAKQDDVFMTALALIDKGMFVAEKNQQAIDLAQQLNSSSQNNTLERVQRIVGEFNKDNQVLSPKQLDMIDKILNLAERDNAFYGQILLALNSANSEIFEPFKTQIQQLKNSTKSRTEIPVWMSQP